MTSIFDVTAGSGAMMEASLTRGAVYHGLCLNKDHQQWLQAIADRAACGLITLEGSTLFNEALAAEIKKFFPDVLESLAPKTDHEEAPVPVSEDCFNLDIMAARLCGPGFHHHRKPILL